MRLRRPGLLSIYVSLGAYVLPALADPNAPEDPNVPEDPLAVFDGKSDAPDFNQLNPNYPNGGSMYCVPTSGADGVVWLHDHGYALLPDASQEETIVNDLAALMGTSPTGGTSTSGKVSGMRSYLERYYDSEYITVEAWDADMWSQAGLEASWQRVKERVARPDTFVLLSGIGFYQGVPVSGTRHCVFLSGYDMTGYEADSAFDAWIHDPFTGPDSSNDWLAFESRVMPSPTRYYYGAYEFPTYPGYTLDELAWTGACSVQITPEPMTLSLLLLGGFGVLRRRAG